MSPVEKLLAQHLEGGQPLSLAMLGGEDAILGDAEALAKSPLFDEVLCLLCQEWASLTKLADFEKLVLSSFQTLHPITLANSLDTLFEHRATLEKIANPLANVLCERIKHRQTELEALLAARALEGLLRLTLEKLATKYALLEALTSVQASELEIFATHVARIISVAYDQWREAELVEALHRITNVPGARAEASFSLGLAVLAQAFEKTSRSEIYTSLDVALTHFQDAAQYSEERDDAVAYGAAIQMVLSFNAPTQQAAAQRAFERLQRVVTTRQLWLHNTHLPAWLGRLVSSDLEWAQLASLLQTARQNFAKPTWLKPIEVLQQFFVTYQVSRSICLNINTRGLEQLIQPQIEAGFLRSQERLMLLEEWLHANQASSEWHDTAILLRERIKILAEQSSSSPTSHPAGGRFPLLVATLGNDIPAGTSDSLLEKMEGVLRVNELSRENYVSIVCERLFRSITARLISCPDYHNEVKDTFDALLLRTINFVDSRINLGQESAGPLQQYLFAWKPGESAPGEKALQTDFWSYLIGFYGNRVHREVSDIATGRVDVILFFPRHQFIAEIKRELRDAQPSNLKKFLGQTTIYQATNIRLGLLLVLDLTDKSKGIQHLEQNVWVETHQVGSFADTRYVVVFRVPGNRIYPSSTRT